MQGGYNIEPLLTALDNEKLAKIAAEALSLSTLLMFDNFRDVAERAKAGNVYANKYYNLGQMHNGSCLCPKLAEKFNCHRI